MQSMTGFGRAEALIGNSHYTFEVKSVNHRFLDARFRLPNGLSQYELQFQEILRAHFERGSFEVGCRQRLNASSNHAAVGTRFVIDEVAAKSIVDGSKWLHDNFNVPLTPSLEVFAMTNRVFVPVDESQDTAQFIEPIKQLFIKAVLDLKTMRTNEGKRLHGLFKTGLNELSSTLKTLRVLGPEQPVKIKEKLEQRLQNWKLGTPIDASRLEWEVALLAEKADITEEMDRLETHIKEYTTFLGSEKPVGRKLDFLTQELNREANTIASKASLIEVTKASVELKTVIERLREQVQNVE